MDALDIQHKLEHADWKRHSKQNPKGKKSRQVHAIANIIKLSRCNNSGFKCYLQHLRKPRMPNGYQQCANLYGE